MMTLPLHHSGHTCQRGMTLIEILVAIVVLSIGLLGLAGLQLKGLQVNQGSTYRWQAAVLAEDMADRIRADKVGATAGSYTLTAGGAPLSSATGGTLAAINEWLARVGTLPGGQAAITAPAGPAGNQVTITVTWLDTRAKGGAGDTSTARGRFDLPTELWN
jgi:type IV pilus assembly protein PilV